LVTRHVPPFWLLVWFGLVRLNVGAIVTGAGGGQLESLDGEGEVLLIGIVHKEPVVDVLLEALGLVAGGHQGAGLPGGAALLNPGGLGESLVVCLDLVHDDPPLAGGVDGTKRLDVSGDGGAEVGLLDQLLQAVNRVVGVGQHILVEGLDSVVVILESGLDLVGGVLLVLQAPSLRVVLGTVRRFVVLRSSVVGRLSMVERSSVVGSSMVGSSVVGSSMAVWSRGVSRLMVGGRGICGLVVGGGLMVGYAG